MTIKETIKDEMIGRRSELDPTPPIKHCVDCTHSKSRLVMLSKEFKEMKLTCKLHNRDLPTPCRDWPRHRQEEQVAVI